MSELDAEDWTQIFQRLEAEVRSRSDAPFASERDDLWQKVGDRVHGIAARILRELPREDLQDVVQAVLLKLQSPQVLDQVLSARFKMGYVVVIVRNTARDLARRRLQERDALQQLGQHFVEFLEPAALEEGSPSDRLGEELARLSSDERKLLALRFWRGLRIGEIAEHRGESYSAVAVRLFRLLRRLESRLRRPATKHGESA
jgi:RNA polymerase sigma factor (sigma-70 family)